MISEEFCAELREKLNQDPANPGLHFSYGSALAELGHFDDAASEYRASLKRQPDWPEALNNLGVVYLEQGRLSDAAGLFDKILQANPQNTAAHNNLGLILTEQNKLEKAAACFRRALEIEPGYQKAQKNLEKVLDDSGNSLAGLEASLFVQVSGEMKEAGKPEPAAGPEPSAEPELSVDMDLSTEPEPLVDTDLSAAPELSLEAEPAVDIDLPAAEKLSTEAELPAEMEPVKTPEIQEAAGAKPKRSPKPRRKKSRGRAGKAGADDSAEVVGLLRYLKDLTGALPEKKQEVFLKSETRLSMEFIITTLEGKKGLLREIREKTPEAALEAPVETAGEKAGKEKITKTLSYLGNLTNTLPDDELAYVLKQKVENIMALMKAGGRDSND